MNRLATGRVRPDGGLEACVTSAGRRSREIGGKKLLPAASAISGDS